jgi:isocitrate lyase
MDRTMQPDGSSAVRRDYAPADVERLAGSFLIRHTLAEMGAARLRHLLESEPFVPTLGALTGNQAVQQVKAGLKAVYLSGWQVAADANTAGQMYPDQSLYPVDSVPNVVRRINNALRRADQISRSEGDGDDMFWMAPIIADAEAGFGGALNAYELMKAMIEAGAAGVHFEDQLASEKKCGHLGGKVLGDKSARPHTQRRPSRGRCRGRADCAAVPHRCAIGAIIDQRHRRARPPVHQRRAHR